MIESSGARIPVWGRRCRFYIFDLVLVLRTRIINTVLDFLVDDDDDRRLNVRRRECATW